MVIHPCNFWTPDVNAADYEACHLQTPLKIIQMTLWCQLETHSLHFSLEHLFLWLPSFFHSQAGGSDWISHEELSLHFSQTPASAFLVSLQFSSLGGSGFGTVKVLASFHRKLGKWGAGMRSGCYLTSHGALHGMPVPSERQEAVTHTHSRTDTHTHTTLTIFHFCKGGSCLWVRVTHVLAHALFPPPTQKPFDPSLPARGAFLHRKTFHMSWLEQNNVYALHSKTTWCICTHTSLPPSLPPSHRHFLVVFSAFTFFSVRNLISLCNSSTCWYINPDKRTAIPWYINPPTNQE